jgi:hypothetical protein
VLIGISNNTTNPSAFKAKGAVQLYSRDRGVSQPIEGHAAGFIEISQDGHQKVTKLFMLSARCDWYQGMFTSAVISPITINPNFVFSYVLLRSTTPLLILCLSRKPWMSTSHLKQ